MAGVCDEELVSIFISKRQEIIEKLSGKISFEVLKETEKIQNKHDTLAKDELTRPFTI